MRRNSEAVVQKRGINAALKPGPRVAGQRQGLASTRDAVGVEKRAFDQHVGRCLRTAGMHAAHDAADVVDATVVSDHGHRLAERIGLAVEGLHLLAVAGLAGDQRAAQLCLVIDVQRAAKIEHDEVGDIDQRRNRLLADGPQFLLEPGRRSAVADPCDRAGIEGRASGHIIGAHIRSRPAARHIKRCHAIRLGKWLQLP